MIAKSSIEAKFRRSGINPKRTWLFTDMADDLKMEINNRFKLLDDEAIIICFYASAEHILLITTKRIIEINKNDLKTYLFNLINDVKLNEIFTDRKTKKDNDIINIVLKSGEQVDLLVETGTWHILYSIIKTLIR